MADKIIITGKRKSSIARVKLTPGSGKFIINKKEPLAYFGRPSLVKNALGPIHLVEKVENYDMSANIVGGGISGQSGALRLALARALENAEPELRAPLKKAGMLTRDARKVERKKYGLHKARKATQFSKR